MNLCKESDRIELHRSNHPGRTTQLNKTRANPKLIELVRSNQPKEMFFVNKMRDLRRELHSHNSILCYSQRNSFLTQASKCVGLSTSTVCSFRCFQMFVKIINVEYQNQISASTRNQILNSLYSSSRIEYMTTY